MCVCWAYETHVDKLMCVCVCVEPMKHMSINKCVCCWAYETYVDMNVCVCVCDELMKHM